MTQQIADKLGLKVQKAFLVDLSKPDGKHVEFLFNPAELEETIGVKWAFHESPGMSHARPQFICGENIRWKITAFYDQLFFEAQRDTGIVAVPNSSVSGFDSLNSGSVLAPDATSASETVEPPSEVEDWRNFILSLMTPRRLVTSGANRFAAASPPRVQFEWPGLVSATVRLQSAVFKHTLFRSGSARTRVYSCDLNMFEDPAERYYSDDIRKTGTIRPWTARKAGDQ